MGKNIRRVVLETARNIGRKVYKSNYLEILISGEEKKYVFSLTNNMGNIWENQTTF
jgi:hypothetical protein